MVTLKLRHLWGAPLAWDFFGQDEATATRMLGDLHGLGADAESRTTVLVAERDGTLVGTWSRDGGRRLIAMIEQEPMSPLWLDIRNALLDAVTGP